MTLNRSKLRTLAHYVIAKSDPSRLGAIRLNKILFYIDSFAYLRDGRSLTGETYIKRQHGPVPKHILGVLGDLEHADAIVIHDHGYTGIREFLPRNDPDVSKLTADELQLIEAVRSHICDNHSATSISLASHDAAWEAANIGEPIPHYAALATNAGEITKDVQKWGNSVVSRYEKIKKATAPAPVPV